MSSSSKPPNPFIGVYWNASLVWEPPAAPSRELSEEEIMSIIRVAFLANHGHGGNEVFEKIQTSTGLGSIHRVRNRWSALRKLAKEAGLLESETIVKADKLDYSEMTSISSPSKTNKSSSSSSSSRSKSKKTSTIPSSSSSKSKSKTKTKTTSLKASRVKSKTSEGLSKPPANDVYEDDDNELDPEFSQTQDSDESSEEETQETQEEDDDDDYDSDHVKDTTPHWTKRGLLDDNGGIRDSPAAAGAIINAMNSSISLRDHLALIKALNATPKPRTDLLLKSGGLSAIRKWISKIGSVPGLIKLLEPLPQFPVSEQALKAIELDSLLLKLREKAKSITLRHRADAVIKSWLPTLHPTLSPLPPIPSPVVPPSLDSSSSLSGSSLLGKRSRNGGGSILKQPGAKRSRKSVSFASGGATVHVFELVPGERTLAPINMSLAMNLNPSGGDWNSEGLALRPSLLQGDSSPGDQIWRPPPYYTTDQNLRRAALASKGPTSECKAQEAREQSSLAEYFPRLSDVPAQPSNSGIRVESTSASGSIALFDPEGPTPTIVTIGGMKYVCPMGTASERAGSPTYMARTVPLPGAASSSKQMAHPMAPRNSNTVTNNNNMPLVPQKAPPQTSLIQQRPQGLPPQQHPANPYPHQQSLPARAPQPVVNSQDLIVINFVVDSIHRNSRYPGDIIPLRVVWQALDARMWSILGSRHLDTFLASFPNHVKLSGSGDDLFIRALQ